MLHTLQDDSLDIHARQCTVGPCDASYLRLQFVSAAQEHSQHD